MKKFLISLKSYVLTTVNSLEPINRENSQYIPDVDKCMNQHILCDISDLASLKYKVLVKK